MYVCVCVCFLLVSERIPKSHHSPETSNNNKAHTHTHTHTHTRILYNNRGSFSRDWWPSRRRFLSERKQKNSRQRKTTTNIVSFLSLYLCGIKDDKHSFIWLYFLILLSFVSIDYHYLLPRRCQLSFPFFLSSLFFVRLKSTEQSITSHISCPLLLAKELFFMVGRNQWQELGAAQHTKTTNKYNPGYYSPNLLLGLADCLFYIPYSTILV